MSALEGVSIHPMALCESDSVGTGTRVWAFAHVMRGAVVGRDCNVGEGAFVEGGAVVGDRVTLKNQVLVWEGVTIEDDVFVGPGVIFTNDRRPRSPRMNAARQRYSEKSSWLEKTTVRRGASLGAGAVIVCGLEIGEFAMVAAGSVVASGVLPYALVVGNPARRIGWICSCGTKLSPELTCRECGLVFRREGEDRILRDPACTAD